MPEMKTEKYTVLKQLAHDGKTYTPGTEIELQPGNADYLLRKRMIGKPQEAEKKAGTAKAEPKGGEA